MKILVSFISICGIGIVEQQGANANVLTESGPPYDPAMGTYQLRVLLYKIYKADA